MPSFIVLGIYFLFGTNFPGMKRLILVSMSNACYLAVILIFLLVTARSLMVTTCYCSLLVVTAHYRSLLLVPNFSMNGLFSHIVQSVLRVLLQAFNASAIICYLMVFTEGRGGVTDLN